MGAEGGVLNLEAILGETLKIDDYHVENPADRPTLAHSGYDSGSDAIPCFDLRSLDLQEFVKAVSDWGFFQVTGHGVKQEVVKAAVDLARTVFDMPLEEKLKAVPGAQTPAGYLCGVVNTGSKNWLESLHSWADPDDFRVAADKLWPQADEAQKFKEVHYRYALAMEKLGLEIFRLLEEGLGVKKTGFSENWEQMKRTFIRFNYYPPCELPEDVIGASAHTDPSLITILHQDEIGGLQIMKDGKWIACRPKPGAFVVNIGDLMQVLSNDVYPSVQHRACVNRYEARFSIATFAFPKEDAVIQPSPELVDEQRGARFRAFKFTDLVKVAKENNYKGKQVLPEFRI